jgi:hypothetical protein
MRVRVGRDQLRTLPHPLADRGPRLTLTVQQRDPPVPKRVRRERRDARVTARPPDRRAKPFGRYLGTEERRGRVAVP